MGVDAVAFLAMGAAIMLGAGLAAIVVAIMYAGGNVLEDFAIARAERDLKSLVDRAPRIAHLSDGSAVRDVAADAVKVGDRVLVRAGEIIPVDGVLVSQAAMIDESALTGERIPVSRATGEGLRSGIFRWVVAEVLKTRETRVPQTSNDGERTFSIPAGPDQYSDSLHMDAENLAASAQAAMSCTR